MSLRTVRLAGECDFDGWREAARHLATRNVTPDETVWLIGRDADLFDMDEDHDMPAPGQSPFSVPRAFVDLAAQAVLHSDPARFARLYNLLWRLLRCRTLLEDAADPLVARIGTMAKAVGRDIHKMHAFVRFRAVETGEGPYFIAWFEPDHHIVEAAAPFFRDRFASMRWSILTPRRSAHWNGRELIFSEGAPRPPDIDDGTEDLWRTYYAAIFNPARLKVDAMRAEMPQKYWKNLPEAPLIKPLIAGATKRSLAMVEAKASEPLPNPQRQIAGRRAETQAGNMLPSGGLNALRAEAAECRRCPLWAPATQTVFGEGPEDATIVFVGEQPGDQEDLAGRPFVGPAGKLFDKAMAEAGVDRGKAYVTNAVKHFKFEPRGKFRLHKKPNAGEVRACNTWLTQEIEAIRPRLLVAMGATAMQGLAGKALPVGENRGKLVRLDDGRGMFVTVHPSFLLRLPDEQTRTREYARFVDDLRAIGKLAEGFV